MPEGDTVYLAAKRMAAALNGQRLTRGELRHPRLAEHDLSGRTVLGVHSVGKHLFTRFDDGRSLHTHFRMDGSWHLYQPGQRWRRPNHQARAVLTTQDRVAVGFPLHDMALLATPDEHRLVGHLGPDLLKPDWDDNDAVIAARRLRERPGVELGLALLDQRIMAGVRNLYWAELLVRHRSDSILSGCALSAER
jgi:endonuclease-8